MRVYISGLYDIDRARIVVVWNRLHYIGLTKFELIVLVSEGVLSDAQHIMVREFDAVCLVRARETVENDQGV